MLDDRYRNRRRMATLDGELDPLEGAQGLDDRLPGQRMHVVAWPAQPSQSAKTASVSEPGA